MTKLTRGQSSQRQSALNYASIDIVIATVWGVFFLVALGVVITDPKPSSNIEIAER